MRTIVYTTNTGSTEKYAKMLSEKMGYPCYSLQDAEKKIKTGTEIIYLGWIMASEINGYRKAEKRYKIVAACAVGMGKTGTQAAEVRAETHIADEIPLFTLQGGFDIRKLHGIYKIMMSIMVKTAGKVLADKANRTEEEEDMLDMMLHGGNRVCEENLQAIYDWCNMQKDSDERYSRTAVRTSMSNYREQEWMVNIPLWAIAEI